MHGVDSLVALFLSPYRIMMSPCSIDLATEKIIREYNDAVALSHSNDYDMDRAAEMGLAAAFREVINQLQVSPGVIECSDLLKIADKISGFNR